MTQYIMLFIKGTGTTVLLWSVSSVISFILGLVTGTIRAKQVRIPILSASADGITLLFRGVPLYAQLMIAYFALPQILGIAPSAFITGCITLGLCSGAYASELIRSGYNNIDQGQWLAAQVLGYSKWQQLYYIIGPQMLKNSFPALTNEYLMLLKSTALVGSIGILEVTKIGTNIMYRTFNPLPVSLVIAAIYLCLSAIISGIIFIIERNYYAQYQ